MDNYNNSTENLDDKSYMNHVHEFSQDTKLGGVYCDRHRHHLVGVTSGPIPLDNGSHKHQIITNSTCTDHYHEVDIFTGPAVSVGGGRHVHRVNEETEVEGFHIHRIKLTTLKNCEGNDNCYCNDECSNVNDDYNEDYTNEDSEKNNCPCSPSNGEGNGNSGNNGGNGSSSSNCTFPSRVKCTCLPIDGACVPCALGHKTKQDIKTKIDRLANNMQVPSVLDAIFFEGARRFSSGQAARTEIERNIYNILSGLSRNGRDVLSCTLNVIGSLPASVKNRLLSPFIKANTSFTADNLVNFLADEVVKVTSLKFLGNPEAMQNPRPGRARVIPIVEGQFILDPLIFFINGIRTGSAIAFTGSPTPEEVERTCTVNQQNQQICTAQTPPCPGNSTLPPNAVCLKVHQVLGGDLVVLQGLNFFTTDAKVIMASKAQPSLRRVISTIVYGDIDTPIRDEEGHRILDTRVKDKLLFAVPEDLPDGIYTIQVEVENKNPDVLLPVPKTYISDPEYLRILPPPTTNFQILAETLKCVEETDGGGSDEVALNFLTSIITRNPNTGAIELSSLNTKEFRFEGVDTGESRPINFAPVQANNLVGVNITIKGYEVDNEEAYKEAITEFEDAYRLGLQSIWTSLASTLVSAVGTAIAVIVGATVAAASAIIAAVSAIVVAAVALFYALWAPADPIIEDGIGLSLVQLADLTNNSSALPPQTTTFTPEGLKLVVDSLEKNVDFRQLRGYFSDDEDSLYQIILRYSRF